MKRAYSAQNTLMVDHLKHVLDAEGIGCVVRNRFLSSAAGRLPPTECWTELWVVDDAQLPSALQLVEKALRNDDRASGDAWECPRCGERLEPQFEACWKCCTVRGGVPEEAPSVDVSPARVPGRRRAALSSNTQLWLILGLLTLTVWYLFRSYGGY